MKKKAYYFSAMVLGLAITTATVASLTFAGNGNMGRLGDQSKDIATLRGQMQQHHQTMKTIMDEGDYDAWDSAMRERVQTMRDGATELETQINQANFDILMQVHQLMQSGDRDGARAILEESGLNFGHRGGFNQGGSFQGKGLHRNMLNLQ